MRLKPPIVVAHAGAGTWRYVDRLEKVVKILKDAVLRGLEYAESSAVDAAVETVKVLEDSGILNAGLGSVTDVLGNVSMDAGVMDGWSGKAGAVAATSYPKNPVLLAKFILESTDHIIVAGSAADYLAKSLGLEKHPGPASHVIKRYEELKKKGLKGEPLKWYSRSFRIAMELLGLGDTVGAVVLDTAGRLAAAVSTGGVIMKLPGRVGDSAVPGAGFYASRYTASVATGLGETVLSSFLTLRIDDFFRSGYDLESAVSEALKKHTEKFGEGTAGVIAVSIYGEVAAAYNTRAMPWAVVSRDLSNVKVLGLPK